MTSFAHTGFRYGRAENGANVTEMDVVTPGAFSGKNEASLDVQDIYCAPIFSGTKQKTLREIPIGAESGVNSTIKNGKICNYISLAQPRPGQAN